MEKRLNYFDMAEEDYLFLKDDYERGKTGNIMCYCSQNVCERYLKHIIDIFAVEKNVTDVLRTHNLKVLRNYIQSYFDDFQCKWQIVMLANGYYFDARYPGDDALITTKEDVDICWAAVEETRRAVISYMESHQSGKDIMDDEVLDAIKGFK